MNLTYFLLNSIKHAKYTLSKNLIFLMNHKFHACTKHVDLRYHFIRTQVSNVIFYLQYYPMEENIADAFTKALPWPRLEKLQAALCLSTT